MKISCNHCGAQNDLGRVFCTSCGKKLDLSQRTSAQEFKGSEAPAVPPVIWKILVLVVVLFVVGVVALAFWCTPPIGEVGDLPGARRVVTKWQNAKVSLRPGKSVGVPLSEREINVYLAQQAQKLQLASLAVVLQPGRFETRVGAAITLPFTVPGFSTNQIPLSYNLSGGFNGGKVAITGVKLGHLPLPGSFQSKATEKILPALAEFTKDQDMIDAITEVNLSTGTVEIVFQK